MISTRTLEQDFKHLTGMVENLHDKPYLSSSIKSHLVGYGHSPDAVNEFVEEYFLKKEDDS